MNFLNAFGAPSRADAAWFSVGLASSFPDIGLDDDDIGNLSQARVCGSSSSDTNNAKPGCKVFHAPLSSSQRTEVSIASGNSDQTKSAESDESSTDIGPPDLADQVMVFRYKGKLHAIDHKCPHSSFPLSEGTPFDIEDFGIVLSAGLTCAKHGWSFDLFSGMGDRGNYRLKIWEVQLRDLKDAASSLVISSDEGPDDNTPKKTTDQEVWVRRRQRMG
ncbi:hypothetical protein B0T17DRAFT_589988 [Bombardia bombarda]|uniref:Rieske domain-containing protein n=1 Tax=Bombardia bombarda TaxID=252184 RepID=A0AA40C9U7_9PEZI|nr:hypothetical protein B0T17DRAFT_589988 [Bombardia bombarda]